jgi:aminoglycoside phosphotransferase (APT) family kinase protein
MHAQYLLLRRLAAQPNPPAVPQTLWYEDDPAVLGAPFFVMDHVDGQIPPDVMPYNFDSWLTEASPADRGRLQVATIEQLARVHASDPTDFAFLHQHAPRETALAAHVRRTREYYEWVRAGDRGIPLIEHAFDWLREHWPRESPAALSWGDARIGNVVYRDFAPVALLDWEMAALGPRELDIGWMLFFHSFFEDIAQRAGLPGLPDMLKPTDVVDSYAEITGYQPAELDFFVVYAALRQAIITVRIQLRAIAFGQSARPVDPDDMIMHRDVLTSMLDDPSAQSGSRD